MKNIIDFLKQVFKEWSDDKVSNLAAALSYYTVFSIPPLIVIVIAIAGRVFENATTRISDELTALLGSQAADVVLQIIENANDPFTDRSTWAIIIGVITLLFGASGVFAQLQASLNTIWDVQPKPSLGIWGTIRTRLLSFGMVLTVGFLLMVSLVASSVTAELSEALAGGAGDIAIAGQVLSFVISLLVTWLLFTLMFKYIPDVIVSWRDLWVGAFITAVLFNVGKLLISVYIGQSEVGSQYGAAGSLIIFLLWVNYSAQIIFFGAEITQVYANRYGSRVRPDEHAIELDDATRLTQGRPRQEVAQELEQTQAAAVADYVQPDMVQLYEERPLIRPKTTADTAKRPGLFSFLLGGILPLVIGILINRRSERD